jgi:spore germination protein
MSEKTQNAFQKYIIPAILAVALIGVILWAAQQKALAESYKNLAKESYVRAYGELTDDLYDMESTLSKLTAVNSPAQYVLLLDEVWRLSGSAVSHMSYLPVSHVDTAELNQFVVRLGDYAHSLTKKAVRGGVMTEEDTNTILQLRDSCAKLAEEYGDKYARGDVPTEGIDAEGYFADNKPQDSEGISEFPTLIYDGPFSESSEKLQPKGLSGGEVTMEQAKTVANIIAGVTFGEGQETGGKIPAYQFSMSNEDGTWAEAAVTK